MKLRPWIDAQRSLWIIGLGATLVACVEAPPPAPVTPQRAVAPPVLQPLPPPPGAGIPPLPPPPAEEPGADEEAHDEGEVPDDEEGVDAPPQPSSSAALSPLLQLSDAEIQARYKKDPTSLGPLSVGRPNAGALVNGVRMPSEPTKWIVLEPGLAWGTQETIDGISKAIERVHTEFPASQPIPIGHISSKAGGYLPVHKSHQAGRDVDLGYYFTTPKQHFVTATQASLDTARTFALVKAFLAVSDIELILIDTSIQKLLVQYAVAHGEDPSWLDKMFQVRQKPGYAPIRHVRGHKNHIHVRFASPQAVALGRRVAGLVAIHPAPPPGTKGAPAAPASPGEKLVAHKARSGDTLQILAKRYGTTVDAIRRANRLKGDALKAGHVYQIPVPPPPKPGAPLPATVQKHSPPPAAPPPLSPPPLPKAAPPKAPKKGKTG